MIITENGNNTWSVKSDSGKTYEVRFLTKIDALGGMYFKWQCSCPSRKYPCKHALAVEAETNGVDAQVEERIS